jgi:hypothetical protein
VQKAEFKTEAPGLGTKRMKTGPDLTQGATVVLPGLSGGTRDDCLVRLLIAGFEASNMPAILYDKDDNLAYMTPA